MDSTEDDGGSYTSSLTVESSVEETHAGGSGRAEETGSGRGLVSREMVKQIYQDEERNVHVALLGTVGRHWRRLET